MNPNDLPNIFNEPIIDPELFRPMSKYAPFMADQKYESICQQIKDFEDSLDADHELAISLASFGREMTMIVTDIGYQNPDLMYFWGTVNGRDSELIQHMNQLNFLITSVERADKSKPARRIGFKLLSDSEDE